MAALQADETVSRTAEHRRVPGGGEIIDSLLPAARYVLSEVIHLLARLHAVLAADAERRVG
jgi:hypothetical protein